MADILAPPWQPCCPREILVPPKCPDNDHRSVARAPRVQFPNGSPGRRPGLQRTGVTTGRHSDSLAHVQSPFQAVRPSRSAPGEAACHVKRLLLLQDVATGPRQFVRQRLGGDDIVGLRFLAFEESPRFGTESPRVPWRLVGLSQATMSACSASCL